MKVPAGCFGLVVLLGIQLQLSGCGEDSAKPYVEFAGGGFIFNYRTANHYYGFVVRQKKPLPAGSKLEARFEVLRIVAETPESPLHRAPIRVQA